MMWKLLRVVGVDDQWRWLVRVHRHHNDCGHDKHLGDVGICHVVLGFGRRLCVSLANQSLNPIYMALL